MRRTDTTTGPAPNQAPRTRAQVAQLLATAQQVRGNRDRYPVRAEMKEYVARSQ